MLELDSILSSLLLLGLCVGAASWKCFWDMASCGLSLQAV